MNRTLIVAGAQAVRLPSLRQPVPRPPALRLVLPDPDGPWHLIPSAAASCPPRGATLPTPPANFDEEDVERWDGLS